ncbi:FtsK/SpoIIIE domain-containing protein [Nocardia sp. XZ_19_369]|uniref:FtsK/SpoIIIE domain-containing protein n=1 Tax=Nocardia sp. XZ_19_369 TaxID=2769487 RepID=UPI00189027A6|nr:FtsK/SpoIIIE domain-containing protein [Nocardia sp. XZ_19_369]
MKLKRHLNIESAVAFTAMCLLGGGGFLAVVMFRKHLTALLGPNLASAVMVTVLVTVIAGFLGERFRRSYNDRRTQALHRAEQAAQDAFVHHAAAAIDDQEARNAVELFCDRQQAPYIWSAHGLGVLPTLDNPAGVAPTLYATDTHPGIEPIDAGARIRLQMPPSHTNLTTYLNKLPDIADEVGAAELDFVGLLDNHRHVLVLDVITRNPLTAPAWQQWLNNYHPRLHHALGQLAEPRAARRMWKRLGIGYDADPRTGEPGAYPALLPGEHNGRPDHGVRKVPVGARVRLSIPTGSRKAFDAKLPDVLSALNVPDGRVVDVDGSEITLELRVVDPIAGLIWSPLISVHEVIGQDGLVRTEFRPTVRPGSLSCHDDIFLGINEHGDPMTHNFAKDGHIVLGGGTRTGKSITLNNIIAQAMLMRDTKVVVIDPNGAATPPWYQLLHLVCEDNDGDAASKVLQEVLDEIGRRKPLFHRLRDDKLTDFSEELPLWVVVIDEAANFRKHAGFNDLLAKVSAQALKFGIILVLSLQQVSEYNLPTAVRTNLTNRLTHRVNDAQDYRMLFPTAPEYTDQVTKRATMPQGMAIASLACHPDPTRMRSAFLPTRACFDIADAIAAVRDFVRELPYPIDDSAYLDKPTSTPPSSRPAPAQPKHLNQQHTEGGVLLLDDYRGVRICDAPDCDNPVPKQQTGRPGRFCSKPCRQIWHRTERKRKRELQDAEDE